MNKSDIVNQIAKEIGCTKVDANKAVEVVLASISKSILKEGGFQLLGIGSFKVVKRGARQGVNPATREKIKIPACKAVKFSPSSVMKQALNPGRK